MTGRPHQSEFRLARGLNLSLTLWLAVAATAGLTGLGQTAAAAPPASPPVVQPAPAAMGKAAFANLLMQVQRRSFGDEKIEVIRDARGAGHHFTCEQVSQLMRTSTAGDEQVKIAAALYPRLVDPDNFPRLTATLAAESDRRKLRQLVGR